MASFEKSFDFVMQHEDADLSGKVTVDRGGRTRFGIASRFHPELTEVFFTGPRELALVTARNIYKRDYWDRIKLDEIKSDDVARKLFDMAVNMGVKQAVGYAQMAVNQLRVFASTRLGGSGDISAYVPVAEVAEDGIAGPFTISRIDYESQTDQRAEKLMYVLRDLSQMHYRRVAAADPSQEKYLAGWLKRAEA